MSPQARDATIKHFSVYLCHLSFLLIDWFPVNNVQVTVFLVSLKAGGVALNLTEVRFRLSSWMLYISCLFFVGVTCLPHG